MKKLLIPFISVLLLISVNHSFSQTTGSFEEIVDFTSTGDYPFKRTLAWYVPTDYNAEKSYTLIVGLRGGPHAFNTDFRNELKVLSNDLNAIILCPDNQKHFNNDENKVKILVNHAIERAIETYHIDTDYIYLTGLSYGGRHTVISSLSSAPTKFKLRGIITWATGTNSEAIPNYEKASSFPPACICSGDKDSDHFQAISKRLHNRIQSNGGISKLRKIPKVGHTTSFSKFKEEFLSCVDFIEENQKPALTTEILKKEIAINVFPNPSKNYINIKKIDNQLTISAIQLLTKDGKILSNFAPNSSVLDISNFGGIDTLLIKITTNNGVIIKKVVVQ